MADLAQLVKPPAETQSDPDFTARSERFITDRWGDVKAAYWIYHSWIWEALLMYAGQLWLRYDNARHGYEIDTPSNPYTPRPRINRFAPAIDAVASVFQHIPDVEAVPCPKDDFKKIGIAEVCNELSAHFIKDLALKSDFRTDEDKVGMAGQWLTLAGCFFTNVFVEEVSMGQREVTAVQPAVNMQCLGCDTNMVAPPEEAQASGGLCPQCGQPMEMTETEQALPQVGEDGSPMMEPMTEKRVKCIIEPPMAAYPQAGAKTMKDAGWLILADRMSLDRIWSELGIEDAHADAEFPDGWNTTAENALNFFYLGYSNFTLSGKDGAMVLRLYMEPNKVKDFPEGCFAIYINGQCKKCVPWPYGKEHPIGKVDFKGLPTLFFPRSVAFDICGVMREFLDQSSIIKLHGMTNASTPWVCESSDNHSEITGGGDQVITWTYRGPGSVAPQRAQAGSLDAGQYTMREMLLEDIEQIAQTVAVWKGEEPAGAKSGKAIDSLRTQASAMFTGPTNNFANGWKEVIRKAVKLAQKEYTTEQLVRIVGDDKLQEISEFQQCELDECIEWIATTGGMPRTQEELKTEMIELFDRGMIDPNDPGVKEKVFKLFGETGMLSMFNKDATRARWENSSMKNGGQPLFMPEFDNNEVHHEIHLDQIKSMDFLGWSPEAKQMLMEHDLETQAEITKRAAIVQAQNQPQQVPPAGPGQPAAAPPQPGGPTQ